ncbi:hypothetical protein [Paraburkholderia graminis]|uniref:hypothetical protein n=1 Tax=Paraburkholderia graminis TaxID=60548 RepID=UPI0038B92D1C
MRNIPARPERPDRPATLAKIIAAASEIADAYRAGVSTAIDQLSKWDDGGDDTTPQQISREWQDHMRMLPEQQRAGFCDAVAAYLFASMTFGKPIMGMWDPITELRDADMST